MVLSVDRGVWTAPFRFNGHNVLLAIDSRNNCIGVTTIEPHVDPLEAEANLWTDLDKRDPLPAPALPPLAVVKAS